MTGSPTVVLDIGSSKVTCLVGEPQEDDQIKVLGMGTTPCRGLRRRVVIDMPKVVEAISTVVAQAERAAGLKITGAYLGMAGEDTVAHTSNSTVAIAGASPIDDRDVQRAVAAADQAVPAGTATVLHRFVQSYAVDGEPVQSPLWLYGSKLEIETLSITASRHACTTLQRAAAEAGIEVAGFILESLATAAALISEDEREMGVALLDIGAGTSDLAIFHGPLRHVAEIPFGGDDITKDLSAVLSMSPRESEVIKLEYGCVCSLTNGPDQTVSFHTTAGRPHTISRHQLSAIVEARQQEILEFVRRELESNRYGQKLAAGLILSGGGSLLPNLAQLGEQVLGMPVRMGVTRGSVSSEPIDDPRCATAIGLLRFALDEQALEGALQPVHSGGGLLSKLAKVLSFFV